MCPQSKKIYQEIQKRKNSFVAERKKEEHTVDKRRDELIVEYGPLIKYIASRLAIRLPPHIDLNDIINSGVLGLMDAIEKFDETKGVQFKTYAEFRIKGAILDNLRTMDWVPRSVRKTATLLENTYVKLEKIFNRPATDEEVAEALQITIEKLHEILTQASGISLLSLEMLSSRDDAKLRLLDCLSDDEGINPLSVLRRQEFKAIIAQAIEYLPEKERLVIFLYYYDDLTMKEISEVLRLTESRISQLHTKAVLRLRGKLREIPLEE